MFFTAFFKQLCISKLRSKRRDKNVVLCGTCMLRFIGQRSRFLKHVIQSIGSRHFRQKTMMDVRNKHWGFLPLTQFSGIKKKVTRTHLNTLWAHRTFHTINTSRHRSRMPSHTWSCKPVVDVIDLRFDASGCSGLFQHLCHVWYWFCMFIEWSLLTSTRLQCNLNGPTVASDCDKSHFQL